MSIQSNPSTVRRLSVSKLRRQPRRELTSRELATYQRIADTLIPAAEGYPSGGGIQGFATQITQALTILDSQFERIAENLARFESVQYEQLWERLRRFSQESPDDFYWLSTVIVGAYLYAAEVKEKVGYPVPHPNPADMFEVAEELSSGILQPVIDRGPIFVTPGSAAD